MIEYLIPPKDVSLYNSLSERAKDEYLYQLWRKYDPNPATEENEALPQFAEKIRYTDEHFATAQQEGRNTDRGRIYIKYGEPDEIKRSDIEQFFQAWESWLYYGRGGRQFIFIDMKGSGLYELIYSSIPEEPSRPGWQGYVDPAIIEFRQ
jgi:GWxTD domain-containing protein